MAEAKSVVNIEVNAEQFNDFIEKFMKYTALLDSLPGQWERVNDEVGNSGESMDTLSQSSAGMDETLRDAAQRAQAMREAMEKALQASEGIHRNTKDTATAHDDVRGAIADTDNATRSLANSAREFSMHMRTGFGAIAEGGLGIEGITKVLQDITYKGKNPLIGAAVGGIAGGLAGGLGTTLGLVAMGNSAVNVQSQARQLGLRGGQLDAFRMDYGRYGDAQGLLEASADGQSDLSKMPQLQMATGKSIAELQQMSPDEISRELMHAADKWWNSTPPELRNAQGFQASGLSAFMTFQDARGYGQMTNQEFDEANKNYAKDSKDFDVSDNANDAAYRAHREMERGKTLFARGMANHGEDVYNDFAKSVAKLNDGMKMLMDKGILSPGTLIAAGTALGTLMGAANGASSALNHIGMMPGWGKPGGGNGSGPRGGGEGEGGEGTGEGAGEGAAAAEEGVGRSLLPSFGDIALSAIGGRVLNWGFGKAGVNSVQTDDAQDAMNWKQATFLEKLEDSPGRAVEFLGGDVFGMDSIASRAKQERIEKDSEYLKEQGRFVDVHAKDAAKAAPKAPAKAAPAIQLPPHPSVVAKVIKALQPISSADAAQMSPWFDSNSALDTMKASQYAFPDRQTELYYQAYLPKFVGQGFDKFLFQGEGAYNVFNHKKGHRRGIGRFDPDKMTLAQIEEDQEHGDMLAVGHYQFIPQYDKKTKTYHSRLRDLARHAGISDNAVFNKDVQNRLGFEIIKEDDKTFYKLITGQIQPTIENEIRALIEISRTWASVPAGRGTKTARGLTADGEMSYWAGEQGNKAAKGWNDKRFIAEAIRPLEVKVVVVDNTRNGISVKPSQNVALATNAAAATA